MVDNNADQSNNNSDENDVSAHYLYYFDTWQKYDFCSKIPTFDGLKDVKRVYFGLKNVIKGVNSVEITLFELYLMLSKPIYKKY